MADFRKWFVVLAMLALFVGTAAAQPSTAFSCVTVAQVTPTLRAEGITELVGDIVLTCTGGNAVPAGAAIPQANVIVTLTQPVTSRLSESNGRSEALLLIDEPGAPVQPIVPGFGSAAPLSVCTSIIGGCTEYAAEAPLNTALFPAGGTTLVHSGTAGNVATTTFNAFQGQVVGTYQVLFAGVPILPPASNNVVRTYRITNIRVNAGGANPLGGNLSAFSLVQAYISTSGPTSLPVSNNVLTVGLVQNSLTATASPVSTVFTQCNATGPINQTITSGSAAPTAPNSVAILNFAENFPSAFKTRVAPLSAAAGSSYLTTLSGPTPNPALAAQNVPGVLYNSESGFVTNYTVGSGSSATNFIAGLADFGTRFKASFTNLPVGVTLYVSATNVNTSTQGTTGGGFFTPIAEPGGAAGSNAAGSYALWTGSETGAFSGVTGTATTAYGGTLRVQSLGTTTASNTSLTAVWEVVNANVAQSETFSFAVFVVYTPGGTAAAPTPTFSPATGGPSVTLSYAPTYNLNTTPAAGLASTSFPIPRFTTNATGTPLLTIVTCQTVLLFPYVTNMSGLETGIAISNTSLDPLTPATPQSQGFCRLHFYGSNGASVTQKPPTTFTCPGPQCLGPILPGNPAFQTTGTVTAATLATTAFGTDVTGYMFAVCDFQYAHGFAFISDSHLTNIAMGYLALVVNNGQTIARPAAQRGESLSN